MKISVELTLTPLQNDYEDHIKSFIKRLRQSGLTILENPLSTQVFGDYDEVMSLLQKEIRTAFGELDASVLQMKIVKTDRSQYEPDF